MMMELSASQNTAINKRKDFKAKIRMKIESDIKK